MYNSVGIIPTLVGVIPMPQRDVFHFAQCIEIVITKLISVGVFPTKFLIKHYT